MQRKEVQGVLKHKIAVLDKRLSNIGISVQFKEKVQEVYKDCNFGFHTKRFKIETKFQAHPKGGPRAASPRAGPEGSLAGAAGAPQAELAEAGCNVARHS